MSEPSERTNQSFRSQFAQASHVHEFVPRNRSIESLPRQRQCSHQSSHSDHTICQLDQLLNSQTTTPPTPSLKDETSESLSSGGSSSSLHTQSTNTGLGGWYGKGQGWIQSPVWTPPVATPVRAKPAFTVRSDKSARGSQQSDEDYHLVSMADKFVDDHDQHQGHVDKDPMFNPSLARLSFSTPPRASHAALYPTSHHHTQPSRQVLDPSQLSPDQIATFVASFSAAPSTQSPLVKQLVARATRLAQGITKPPPNRGFRAKANEAPDNDETNTTVFVGGLSEGVTESLLNDIFAPFGSITYVKVPPGKGCGFVQFNSKKDSEYAIKQMQGFECMGCSLRTHWGRSQTERSTPLAPALEQTKDQVSSICAALGVPREHTDLVFKIWHAIDAKSSAPFSPTMTT